MIGSQNLSTVTVRKICDDLKVYNNFASILDKCEADGYIQCITDSMGSIIQAEVSYARKGKLNRADSPKRAESRT